MENIKVHVVTRIFLASDSHHELFEHQSIHASYGFVWLCSVFIWLFCLFLLYLCVFDLECKVELVSVKV